MYLEVYENLYHSWEIIKTGEKFNYFYLRLIIDDRIVVSNINSYIDCPIFDEIMKEYNGIYFFYKFYNFKLKEDAEKVIEILEPYLIMTNLIR